MYFYFLKKEKIIRISFIERSFYNKEKYDFLLIEISKNIINQIFIIVFKNLNF